MDVEQSVKPLASSNGPMSFLLVIDFDYTITEKNTDDWLLQTLLSAKKVKELTEKWYSGDCTWQDLMKSGFQALKEEKVSPDQIFKVLEEIPLVKGFKEFLKLVGSHKECKVVIASDSNTVFIDKIFKKHDLEKYVDEIFTNPAHFDEEDCLRLFAHHSHSCTTCQPNICKQEILRSYLEEEGKRGNKYERIFVIGDGSNDFCPCKILDDRGCIFPRKGYRLMKKIEKLKDTNSKDDIKASVIPWENGEDLLVSFQRETGLDLK
ncbi:Phosphoethanolamine/phosphocholine phosphatase [Holothuria leucospilota]|uniref:Phosphoethanolamine/phosphocholine phosphatase n=1 Tax=Holothuria leucospilota TaxID=206669 RepID=A0A9Q0YLU0_HOLLE|nr:Phosphoethanolamine/phosphocholine phosphatase [Holothuria leucospilota]